MHGAWLLLHGYVRRAIIVILANEMHMHTQGDATLALNCESLRK